MKSVDNRAGIWLMIGAMMAYTVQDGISRFLAGEYSVWMSVMTRYWFFASFVVLWAMRRPNGLKAAVTTRKQGLHLMRALIHVSEICVIVFSFTLLGLINTHALFLVCPLIVAFLSGPILGEKVGLRLWLAIGTGFAGILVILRPGSDVFSLLAALPLLSALMFALYSVLTRLATRDEDSFVSFFWSGVLGAVLMTCVGIWFWEPMPLAHWALTAANGLVAVVANYLLIQCYSRAEASVVQPFAYFQLVFVMIMGVTLFNETLELATVIGGVIVICAGLSTLWNVSPMGKKTLRNG